MCLGLVQKSKIAHFENSITSFFLFSMEPEGILSQSIGLIT
jgi:hypothetical protein